MNTYARAFSALVCAFLALGSSAGATGTALVQQADGSSKTYTNVSIRLAHQDLALTTSDGVGTLVIGRAACKKVGELVECLPYDATLFQHGEKNQVKIKSGSVWLNPTTNVQVLPLGSAQVKPHGVALTLTSQSGTSISLSGTVDEVQK